MDNNNIDNGCTHNCSTCGSACGTTDGERKPSFFDRLDQIGAKYEEIGEDNMLDMLNNLVKELEKDDDSESDNGSDNK